MPAVSLLLYRHHETSSPSCLLSRQRLLSMSGASLAAMPSLGRRSISAAGGYFHRRHHAACYWWMALFDKQVPLSLIAIAGDAGREPVRERDRLLDISSS